MKLPELEPVFIVFDGPPGPKAPGFVEVETAGGISIKAGEWNQYGDYWTLGPLYTQPIPQPEGLDEIERLKVRGESHRCAQGKGAGMKTITYDPALWQVVPKEPTQDMFNTGFYGHSNKETWERMLAVAPSPPEVEVEPVAWYIHGPDELTDSLSRAKKAEEAGLDVSDLYLHPPTEENEVLRRDAERLNFLDSKGGNWLARNSTTGRGYRVHQDPITARHTSAREAIDAAMKESKNEAA